MEIDKIKWKINKQKYVIDIHFRKRERKKKI